MVDDHRCNDTLIFTQARQGSEFLFQQQDIVQALNSLGGSLQHRFGTVDSDYPGKSLRQQMQQLPITRSDIERRCGVDIVVTD